MITCKEMQSNFGVFDPKKSESYTQTTLNLECNDLGYYFLKNVGRGTKPAYKFKVVNPLLAIELKANPTFLLKAEYLLSMLCNVLLQEVYHFSPSKSI